MTYAGKTPAELAAEMERMAELHPHSFWSIVMREGAAMIVTLAGADDPERT